MEKKHRKYRLIEIFLRISFFFKITTFFTNSERNKSIEIDFQNLIPHISVLI